MRLEARRRATELARQWEADRPIRRRLLSGGPSLTNIDAALECRCTCHPRPADATVHDGGIDCPCQKTSEQRRAAVEQLTERWERIDLAGDVDAVDALATELGVVVSQIGGFAPFTIEAVVDGRACFLRSRHGSYRIEVAHPDTPLRPPTELDATTVEIDAGSDDVLEGDGEPFEVAALKYMVASVRNHLAKATCTHITVRGCRFCPRCGVELELAANWQHL